MKSRRCITYLLACLLLLPGCGKKPAPPARPRPPAHVNETDVPTVGKPWTVPDLGLELVFVEEGSFMMGAEDGEDNEKPVHEVRIAQPFWMGTYEVTQREYEAIAGSNPSHWETGLVLKPIEGGGDSLQVFTITTSDILGETSDFPVESVSWHDAVTFCGGLTLRERRAGRLPDDYAFRLPTEAEWEYVARGGPKSSSYAYSGGDDPAEVAWYSDNSEGRPHKVGGRKPNELGPYDMSGNVWEWCLDWYDGGYYGKSVRTDPTGPAARTGRVTRGGSWENPSRDARASRRVGRTPAYMAYSLSFRVVLAPAIEQPEK